MEKTKIYSRFIFKLIEWLKKNDYRPIKRISNQLKQNTMKAYKLIFLTKQGAELQTKELTAKNKKEAKEIAKKVLANSMLNDLHKIIVKTV